MRQNLVDTKYEQLILFSIGVVEIDGGEEYKNPNGVK
jgi:hypothetical protein